MKHFLIALLICCFLLTIAVSANAACGYQWKYYIEPTYFNGMHGGWVTTTCVLTEHQTSYSKNGSGQHDVRIKHSDGSASTYQVLSTENCLPITDYGFAATCTVSGKTDGSHCGLCKQTLVAQTPISPTGHSAVIDAEVAPTCTSPGKTIGQHCTVCDTIILAQTEIPATGHSMQNTGPVPATCTTPGKTASQTCIVCGYSEGGTDIPATGHNEEIIPGYPATETQTGLTDGKKCSACGEVTVPQQEIPMLAHTHTEETVPGYAATCTETGLTDGKKCSACGTITVAQTAIPVKGHTEETIKGKAATCTETGLTDGKKCSACGTITVAQTTIPANDHGFWGEWSLSGYGNHIRYCNRGCGEHTTVKCQQLSVVIGDATLTICPICGRYGDEEAELLKEAAITNSAADKPGTFIACAALYPVENNAECLAVVTAVYERNGRIVELAENAAAVTVKLPLPVDAPCQLVYVTIDEMTQEQVLVPVEYSVENGNMVFTVNQLGLFLLIAE